MAVFIDVFADCPSTDFATNWYTSYLAFGSAAIARYRYSGLAQRQLDVSQHWLSNFSFVSDCSSWRYPTLTSHSLHVSSISSLTRPLIKGENCEEVV